MKLNRVTLQEFRLVLGFARWAVPTIAEYTSTPEDMPEDADYYATEDGMSGFGVTRDAELVGLFSRVKGRGDMLVSAAGGAGAMRLDCFDGYLPELYARHGWREVRRVANWTPGGPDVVYMSRV